MGFNQTPSKALRADDEREKIKFENLRGFIDDVNENEIRDHLDTEDGLRNWLSAWHRAIEECIQEIEVEHYGN